MRARSKIAAISALITVLAVAVSHLVAALVSPTASPFIMIGGLFIDLTPTPLKTFAVETFGNADKPILLASIGIVVLMLAALAGAIFYKSKRELKLVLLTLSAVPLVFALVLQSLNFANVLPSLVVVIVAWAGTKLWFDKFEMVPLSGWDSPTVIDEDAATESVVSRRTILATAGTFVLLSAVAGTVGKIVSDAKSTLANIVLPKPKNPLSPKVSNIEKDIPGLSKLVTPNKDFYRVDINLAVPVVDQNDWTLEIKRKGYKTAVYSYSDILDMDLIERDITLVCVSNTVGGEYVGSARWLGVDLKKLLEPFEPEKGNVDQIFSTSTDGYTSSSPLREALDGRESMIAVGMNGEVLPRTHGFPARLIIPGIFGFVGATKWLKTIELTTYDAKESYWTKRKWAIDAPIKPQTRIDVPASFGQVKSETVIAGVAWAGVRGVSSVQVSIDDGSWRNAMIDESTGGQNDAFAEGVLKNDVDYWVQWMLPVELDPGRHSVRARCVTRDGEIQTAEKAGSFPDGSSGIASKSFTVS